MIPNKLYFNSSLKVLQNKDNFLVWWFPWNGIIRNKDGEEIGTLTNQIIDKLFENDKLKFIGNGSGLLDHERYYIVNQAI